MTIVGWLKAYVLVMLVLLLATYATCTHPGAVEALKNNFNSIYPLLVVQAIIAATTPYVTAKVLNAIAVGAERLGIKMNKNLVRDYTIASLTSLMLAATELATIIVYMLGGSPLVLCVIPPTLAAETTTLTLITLGLTQTTRTLHEVAALCSHYP